MPCDRSVGTNRRDTLMELLTASAHDAVMSADRTTGFTDIDRQHWSLRYLPPWARPFGRLARWDRPIGIWLLLFPCWWSVDLGEGALRGTSPWGALAG